MERERISGLEGTTGEGLKRERKSKHVKIDNGRLTHLDHLPSQLIDGTRDTYRGDEGRTSNLRGRWRD
jgi:hypothetical protein